MQSMITTISGDDDPFAELEALPGAFKPRIRQHNFMLNEDSAKTRRAVEVRDQMNGIHAMIAMIGESIDVAEELDDEDLETALEFAASECADLSQYLTELSWKLR